MADDMQRARELAETLDALADDTRGHSLNGEQHDHLREAAAALRAAPEGYALIRLNRAPRKLPDAKPKGKKLVEMIRILSEGPATTMEIAEEMDDDSRITSSNLASAWRRGWLAKKPYKDPQTGQIVQMWMLAEHAEALGGTLA